jgi:hypothetical protein
MNLLKRTEAGMYYLINALPSMGASRLYTC